MKRFVKWVVVAAFAGGAQSVWSGEGHTPYENDPRDTEAYFQSIAAVGVSADRQEIMEVRSVPHAESLLEAMGFAGEGVFPSHGGLISD